jgi:glycosyltransferase involved in cell wall biosynthesis
MKVAHCIHGLGLGGAQQVIRALVRRGNRSAFEHFVYSSSDGLFRAPIEAAGATVRVIVRRVPKLDPQWALALRRAMRADRIDIVHTHLFGDSLHGYIAARLAGALPVVMTLHNGVAACTRLQRVGYRWLLRRAAGRVACTESARESFAALAPDVETIANGIEPLPPAALDGAARAAARAALGLGGDGLVIGASGRMVEQKDFATLIEAFARLRQLGAPLAALVLVGDGPLRGALEQQAQRVGVRTLIHFAGLRDDARGLLPACDVVAFSSRFEGLSIALLEAMAAARCLVATRAAGITDVVDQRQALLVPVGDPAALAAALATALADAGLRARLGAAAQARFLAGFTAERMVAGYERLYRAVAEGA